MKQLSIFVENKVGSLVKVTTVLAENDVNLRAFSVFDSPEFCILRMIVSETKKAKAILENNGFAVGVTEVLAVELFDEPGSLNRMLEVVKEEGININYIYSFVYQKEGSPYMVINLNNMEVAKDALTKANIKIVE